MPTSSTVRKRTEKFFAKKWQNQSLHATGSVIFRCVLSTYTSSQLLLFPEIKATCHMRFCMFPNIDEYFELRVFVSGMLSTLQPKQKSQQFGCIHTDEIILYLLSESARYQEEQRVLQSTLGEGLKNARRSAGNLKRHGEHHIESRKQQL